LIKVGEEEIGQKMEKAGFDKKRRRWDAVEKEMAISRELLVEVEGKHETADQIDRISPTLSERLGLAR
jgi:hypothetical protein